MEKEIKAVIKNNKTLTAIKISALIFYVLGGFILVSAGIFFGLTYGPIIMDVELQNGLWLIIGAAFSYVGFCGGLLLIVLAIITNVFYFVRKRKLIASTKFLLDNPELK